MIRDKRAEELESRGLYRRAAARWADIMAKCAGDEEWKQAKRRHEACLRRSKRPEVKPDIFCDLHKAVRETQHRMGIARPGGEAFRLPVSKKNTGK